MKQYLLLLLSILSLSVYAYDHAYRATGILENGEPVEGTVFSNIGDSDVSGEVINKDGTVHSFEGQWIGDGRVSGRTDDGDALELTLNR